MNDIGNNEGFLYYIALALFVGAPLWGILLFDIHMWMLGLR